MTENVTYPFKQFENFLNKEIDEKLAKFYFSFKSEHFHQRVKYIDNKNHQVQFLKDSYEVGELEYETISFEDEIKNTILNNIQIGLDLITNKIQSTFSNQQSLIGLINFYQADIDRVFNQQIVEKFPFLAKYKNQILERISYYIPKKKNGQNDGMNGFTDLSFTILAKNEGERIEKIEKLYSLLIKSPAMIECTFEEFQNAFTNRPINTGIKWLVRSQKNSKSISKPSLIYFLNQLADNNHLNKEYHSFKNKYIIKVFREEDGSKIDSKRLSSAMYQMSETPTFKDRIDEIISSL